MVRIFGRKKSKEELLDELGPIYHSYRLFGVNNKAIPKFFRNQKCKEPIILSYILNALAKTRDENPGQKASFAELFCADGYYALAAAYFGATKSIGIDNNRGKHFERANQIRDILGISNCEFLEMDVNDLDTLDPIDIVANIGGLYHVENPEQILDKSYTLASKYLIVQNVVSLATDSDNYFESPAPGWTWGSRYSKQSFTNLIYEKGWNVVDSHFNHLEGNKALTSKGSLYFLIKK